VKQFQSVAPPCATIGEDGTLGPPRRWNQIDTIAELPEAAYAALEAVAERLAIQAADQEGEHEQVAETAICYTRTGGNGKLRTGSRPGPETRAAKYLEKADPSIDGQGGHNTAMRVAGDVVAFGITDPETVYRILLPWNDRCVPPWSEAELRHKAEEACRLETRRDLLEAGSVASVANHKAVAAGANGQAPAATAEAVVDTRPVITITTDEHIVIDNAVAAIAVEANLFQRGGSLVAILADTKPKPKRHDLARPKCSIRIISLPKPQLRRLMTLHARWKKWAKHEKGFKLADAHPPDWAVDGAATLGRWPGLRPLEGIVEAPTLRPDGSLIDQAGYDPDTGLWFAPDGDFPAIPEKPSKARAAGAVAELEALVEDFPFATREHKAAWLAALLTALTRPAIDGPCPLFLFDANCPGTGKSLLCDIIAILATGREMARGAYPDDDTEMEKVILSIVMSGDRFVLFDNVATGGAIGGPALDRALTGRTWKGRILGRTEWTPDLPLDCLFFATGNNLGLRGDALRRVVPCRLETTMERPEERTGFKIPCLLAHVKRNRGRLVAEALTILRGYLAAGRPDPGLTPMDYPAWCGLIRNAVHWATGIDPCEPRHTLIANDEEATVFRALVAGWEKLCELHNGPMTAAAALKAIEQAPAGIVELEALRDVLLSWSKDGGLPSARTVGNRLKAIKGRIAGGKALRSEIYNGNTRWLVK
jgi:hypothetical protein